MKQALSPRAGHQQANAGRTGRSPHQRHAVGVTAEGGDVALYPFQGRDLVAKAIIAERPFGCAVRQRPVNQESGTSEPEVERDEYHAGLSQRRAVG